MDRLVGDALGDHVLQGMHKTCFRQPRCVKGQSSLTSASISLTHLPYSLVSERLGNVPRADITRRLESETCTGRMLLLPGPCLATILEPLGALDVDRNQGWLTVTCVGKL